MLRYVEKKIENTDTLVFFLHGYGSNEMDLIGLGDFLKSDKRKISFISVRAPEICSNYSLGYQWFPLDNVLFPIKMDAVAKEKTTIMEIIGQRSSELSDFIGKKVMEYEVAYNNVFLLGFSQGALLALHVGLRIQKRIGGIASFSGFVLDEENFFSEEKFYKQNVLFLYGLEDNRIDAESFIRTRNLLEKYLKGCSRTIEYANLQHNIDFRELMDIKEYFLKK
jgi:phospholipase/carboxylesterase